MALPAERFAAIVRSHWRIENSLHWVLDVIFKEDLSRLRKGHGARNMAVVRHFALNLVRAATTNEASNGGENVPLSTTNTSPKSSAHRPVNLDSLPWADTANTARHGQHGQHANTAKHGQATSKGLHPRRNNARARFSRRQCDRLAPCPRWGRYETATESAMAKAYWVATYRSISNPDALAAYAKLAGPAILAAGGRFLARGVAVAAYEADLRRAPSLSNFRAWRSRRRP